MERPAWIPADADDEEADGLEERAAIKEFCGDPQITREVAQTQAVAEWRKRQARGRREP